MQKDENLKKFAPCNRNGNLEWLLSQKTP